MIRSFKYRMRPGALRARIDFASDALGRAQRHHDSIEARLAKAREALESVEAREVAGA